MSRKVFSEKTLKTSARPCATCGKEDIHNYHFMSTHLHPGNKSKKELVNVEHDDLCSCGHCCGCFLQESRVKAAQKEEMELLPDITSKVYFQSLCNTCVKGDDSFTNDVYHWCLHCYLNHFCPKCNDPNDSAVFTMQFSDYENATINCSSCPTSYKIRECNVNYLV